MTFVPAFYGVGIFDTSRFDIISEPAPTLAPTTVTIVPSEVNQLSISKNEVNTLSQTAKDVNDLAVSKSEVNTPTVSKKNVNECTVSVSQN